MRIVHYTLGIYPKRIGGLNRYATDLMMEQSNEHEVSVITPGSWKPWSTKVSIRGKGNNWKIKCYELRNALPLPLLYGIKKPQDFVNKGIDRFAFEIFLDAVKPEVIHMHTLMGMPEAALKFFKDHGVKIVYTSHDYFGICPKVNLINLNGVLCEGPSPERCAACNEKSPSTFFLRMRNSDLAFISRDFTKWLKNILHF